MKGLINAVGNEDSLGKSRSSEIRGLIQFGGKSLVEHILQKLEEGNIGETLILTNPSHENRYRSKLAKKGNKVIIVPYSGNQDPLAVYLTGALMLEDDAFIVADDNLFDFSIAPMIEMFKKVQGSVLATLPLQRIIEGSTEDLNFGTCLVGEDGKISEASYSFDASTKLDSSQKVVLDLYAVHRNQIAQAKNIAEQGVGGLAAAWYSGFYAWEPKDGFWADIGKAPLRTKAESYFNK